MLKNVSEQHKVSSQKKKKIQERSHILRQKKSQNYKDVNFIKLNVAIIKFTAETFMRLDS